MFEKTIRKVLYLPIMLIVILQWSEGVRPDEKALKKKMAKLWKNVIDTSLQRLRKSCPVWTDRRCLRIASLVWQTSTLWRDVCVSTSLEEFYLGWWYRPLLPAVQRLRQDCASECLFTMSLGHVHLPLLFSLPPTSSSLMLPYRIAFSRSRCDIIDT